MVVALIWLNAIGFVLFGIAGLLMPASLVGIVGYDLLTTDAAIEVRAQYGGLFIAIGAFALWGLLRTNMRTASLVLLTFVYAGLAIGRLTGLMLETGEAGTYTLGATGFELVMTAALGAALIRDAGSR